MAYSSGSKGQGPQEVAMAKGGAPLGRVRQFMKEPDEFRNPDNISSAPNADNKYAKSGEGAGKGNVAPPPEASKSSKDKETNVKGNAGAKADHDSDPNDGSYGKSGNGHSNMSGGDGIPSGHNNVRDGSPNVKSEGRYAKKGATEGQHSVEWASTPGKGDESGFEGAKSGSKHGREITHGQDFKGGDNVTRGSCSK